MQLHNLLLGSFACFSAVTVSALSSATVDDQFERGRALFDHAFSVEEGVGAPEMNADSCRACHQDPSLGGAGPLEVNVSRFGRDNGGLGPFEDPIDGQALSKLYPPTIHGREEYAAFGATAPDVFEQRQAPALFGNGLVDSIPAAVIVANEDVNDADGDGIYGVARRLTVNGVIEIGRYGWKAQIPSISDFVGDAMFHELGITTPDDGRGFATASDGDAVADPELSQAEVDDLSYFLHELPAPERGGSTDPQVTEGLAVFSQVGCAKCHTPSLPSPMGPVPLYSNLLLHNVMPAGFRGMAEPGAGVGYYRTPPLWGIGDTAPYMHDGRAEDLDAAILAHDGEAAGVRSNYEALTPAAQQALILFLEDL